MRSLPLRALFLLAGVALAVHLTVLATWKFSVLPELKAAQNADRLRITAIRRFRPIPEFWQPIAVPGLYVPLPLKKEVDPQASPCVAPCQIPLVDGSLTIFARPLPEDYRGTLLTFAPDARDVSWLQSPWRNWKTIVAIAARVLNTSSLPHVFRYQAPNSRGVVIFHESRGIPRYVIYAYSADSSSGRVLALSRVPHATLLSILAGIVFETERGNGA